MHLRTPAMPLITIDPFFSVWCVSDKLNDTTTKHWTSKENAMLGTVTIDDKDYIFMGIKEAGEKIEQTSCDFDALSSFYTFENEQIRLKLVFTSPLLVEDLYLSSRPVSYLKASVEYLDKKQHKVTVSIKMGEQLCLQHLGQSRVEFKKGTINNIPYCKMGNAIQNTLGFAGDAVCIDWGYLYIALRGNGYACPSQIRGAGLSVNAIAEIDENNDALFLLAYDDIKSIEYMGDKLNAYWKTKCKSVEEAISEAANDYEATIKKCDAFSKKLYFDAKTAGGEKYAELLCLSYRQVMAAHKLVVDNNGNNLYISKECYSNGCAATVDVTYPSAPMYLYYNVELLKGMLRPILEYSYSDEWKQWSYDFAPHDIGTYPILNGQVYWIEMLKGQMPVEECGNMLILLANICIKEGNANFAKPHILLLENWTKYLIENGEDPANQLCTDDFNGHLAHNCNLSLKAIMGIAGYSIILKMLGVNKSQSYMETARKMAQNWCKTAENGDGSFKLAFDKPDTFSLKYNMVWDKLWKTNLFPSKIMNSEALSYLSHANPYGIPLDNRAMTTKSDWMIWAATLCNEKADFEKFTELLWNAYNLSPSRVPMTDYFNTVTSLMTQFQNRTVQGGLWIKLLEN